MSTSEDSFGRPLIECVCCGGEIAVERDYERLGVCGNCVRRLANSFWLAHAGEPHRDFATQAEIEEFRAGRRPRYVKAIIPEALRWEVFERDGYRCKSCGTGRRLTVDHIHPEVEGGTLELINLQTLCRPCNSRKGDRP